MKQTTKKSSFEGVHFKNKVAHALDPTGAELLDDSFLKLDQAF